MGAAVHAALNGHREHPATPCTPDQLAAKARAAVAAGAALLHLHQYDETGQQTLWAQPCAAALAPFAPVPGASDGSAKHRIIHRLARITNRSR